MKGFQTVTRSLQRLPRFIAVSTLLAVLIVSSIASWAAPRPALAADATPQVIKEKWQNANTLDLYVTSPNIDTSYKIVRLIVPNGWSKDSTRTWPTLWLLHGGMGDYTDWTKNTDVAQLVANHDVMVVMPDTSWCSSYTDWYNYGKYGKPAWDTFVTKDVRTILENSYHANTTRAIAGLSMGGLGALKLPASHQDMFTAAAAFSGEVDPLHSYNGTSDTPNLPGLTCAADWKRTWGDYRIPAEKIIWQQNDPYDQADKLAYLKYLYVSSGDGQSNPLKVGFLNQDPVEQGVYPENVALVQKLQSLGIPVDSHFYGGTHSWPYWQRELHNAFPGILKALDIN